MSFSSKILWHLQLKGEASRIIFCRLGEWKIILETYRKKFGEIWIIQSRAMIFQSFDYFLVCCPLRWHSGAIICDVTTEQLSNGTTCILVHIYTNFTTFFMKMYLPPFSYLGMLGLWWLCMHLWLKLHRPDYWYPRKIKTCEIYVQSQKRDFVFSWYHRFWQSSIQTGQHTKLCIISSLERIAQNVTSAVYTCIKKPESFSHSGFSLKVARQLPLNTPKNPPPQRDFLKLRWNFTGFLPM